ncbi:hypothetical protein [Candidatus Mycoplasma mahonii]|uniref:hypothetical protein n=1 Tax=Candidatus Mycoplasma mahonii TaxID=3004105 RepID=UPI0026EDB07A|nr:hypothetical protein [Candidatus Mycoplasma mahonii]WKX02814.1 hypothetical protein O3I44_01945 [Candidatus Mycoplasma mahonii]
MANDDLIDQIAAKTIAINAHFVIRWDINTIAVIENPNARFKIIDLKKKLIP